MGYDMLTKSQNVNISFTKYEYMILTIKGELLCAKS